MPSKLLTAGRKTRIAACAVAAALAWLPVAAGAMTAEEAFADGNRLFRDDLYWAALLRYRQAAEAGLDTPLLHYNTGVAHYKAGQYDRAREALLAARQSPSLRLIATYNLGLTEYAAGNDAAALRWFREARDQEENRQIRELAMRAIARIGEQRAVTVATVPTVRAVREERPFTDLELYARVGLGNDDNVYRSPSESYVDLGSPGQPVVDPVVQSGMFYPVRLGAKYSVNALERESFFGGYRMAGRFYPDEALKNADEYIHELAFGTEYDRREENRRSRIFSQFAVAQHEETYYDPDTGIERTVNDEPIDDRLSYVRYGPEIWTRQSWERFTFSLHGKAQLWNYERTPAVPEYDHEYFEIGGYAQYRFTKTSLLRLTADAYQRNFSSRPSFDLDGTQSIGNPAVEYDYLAAGVIARQRVTRSLWFGVNYGRTERRDGFVGYNDYTRNEYGFEVSWRAGERFELRGDATYRVYDFPNALAFNDPAGGPKTLETVASRVYASVLLGWGLTLVGEFNYTDVASNDARIAYERSRYLLSLQWSYD